MPATTRTADVIVIGAGAAGENAADRTAQGGLKTILVESALIGGECSYWACQPSKALLRPGTVLRAAGAVDGARQAVHAGLDVAAVLTRRDEAAAHWDDSGQAEWVESAGIGLVRGTARLTGERTVTVATADGTVDITATHAVVLATGSAPVIPGLEGLDSVPYWGTREATAARQIPDSLLVLGGGVSGCELAQAFARLGSAVTLIARGDILTKVPEPARRLVEAGLRADGVDIRLHTGAVKVREHDGGVRLTLADGGETLTAARLLVSAGRHPNLAGLGLDTVGNPGTAGRIAVDPSGLVAGVPGSWLYAVGDAAGTAQLTHQGKYAARAAGDAIVARSRGELDGAPGPWSRFAATANDAAVPSVIFTDPEVAGVGLSLSQARERGLNTSATELPISVAGATLHADDYQGWAQMLVDEDRKVVIGMTFAGPEVSELLHAATIAVVGQVPLDRLWHAVPAFPTISEVWLRLLEKYGL